MTAEQKIRRAAKLLANIRDNYKFSERKNALYVALELNRINCDLTCVIEMIKDENVVYRNGTCNITDAGADAPGLPKSVTSRVEKWFPESEKALDELRQAFEKLKETWGS